MTVLFRQAVVYWQKINRGGDRMHPQFAELTPRWFKRAFVYTGSIGDFRYRFDMEKEKITVKSLAV